MESKSNFKVTSVYDKIEKTLECGCIVTILDPTAGLFKVHFHIEDQEHKRQVLLSLSNEIVADMTRKSLMSTQNC